MKLLLRKDVKHLGLIGDIVTVKNGYARNYLIPQNLAVAPTEANIKSVEEARLKADAERKALMADRKAAADRLSGTEITISAAANAEGHLYGSVGPREIAAALRDEGHNIEAAQVELHAPIRHLDNIAVPVTFMDDLTVEVKVWVVRQAGSEELDEKPDTHSMEASHGDAHEGEADSGP